jgi:ribosomal protein S18 acetylase RimI-like enzyme
MVIRTANIMDIEKILDLEKQVFEIHFKARPDLIKKFPMNYEFVKNLIEGNTGKIFIAEENEQIIGHCIINIRVIKDHHLFHDMKNIEIDDMCIDENYRRKGVGKKLFEEVEKYAKEIGVNNIELMVWEFNQSARKFYEYIGFKTRISRMEYKIQ